MTLDELGVAFAQACNDAGLAGFALRLTEDGDVKYIGPWLPDGVIAKILREAAEAYEETVGPRNVN